MMTHGNTPLPDYMAHAGERKEHPYLMYDNILATPALMSQCLEECGEQIRHISDQIIKRGIQRFFLTGCGTSQFVGKQIAYALEQMAKMPAQAENPFEIFHYPPVELDEHAALVVISHSGNTLTDRQVAEMGRKRGAFVICFTDNPQATLLPYVDEAVIGPGGRDMAIPKTRSYTTSLLRGMMLVSDIARTKGLAGFDDEIEKLPQLAAKTIADNEEKVKHLVAEWKDIDRYFAVGAGPNAWTGMESALKIMETIGFPAFGFELEEYTHGPELSLSKQNGIFFFQSDTPTVGRALIAARASVAAKSKVAVMTNVPGSGWPIEATIFVVTKTHEMLSPMLMILIGQLFTYYTALRLGRNPDMAGTNNPGILDAILILHPAGSH